MASGVFTQRDPVLDGANWYTYVSGGVMTAVDPSGMDATSQVIGKGATRAVGCYIAKRLGEQASQFAPRTRYARCYIAKRLGEQACLRVSDRAFPDYSWLSLRTPVDATRRSLGAEALGVRPRCAPCYAALGARRHHRDVIYITYSSPIGVWRRVHPVA